MKTILTALALMVALSMTAQEKVMRFQGNKILLNSWGESKQLNTVKPVMVIVNYDAKTITIDTDDADIKKLFKNKMVRELKSEMGEFGIKYSLEMDDMTFMHVHNDTGIILFTRSDIHPKEWGLQIQEFEKVE